MPDRSPLELRLRTSARIGLYSSFLLTAALFFLSKPWVTQALKVTLDTEWSNFDFEGERSVQNLQALLQVDTTEATGQEVEAAEVLADVLKSHGISAHIERLIEGRANLWAVIEGKSPQALVLHNHIDTDPILSPDKWTHGPFSGEIKAPWIYGRGAFDMKSVAAAQLEAFLRVKEHMDQTGVQPEKSVIFLATSSEETGSHLGAQWIVRQHPELVSRFWAVLTEGGVVEATDRKSIKYWGTSFGQKHFAQLYACSRSKQRLLDLFEDLSTRGHLLTNLELIEPVDTFLQSYAPSRQETSFRRILSEPAKVPMNLEDFNFLPGYMQALFRNEVHAFPIEDDPDSGGYRMRLMVHLRPGQELDRAVQELLPPWMVHGIGISSEGPLGSSTTSPLDHPVFLAAQNLLRDSFETEATGPFFLSYYANDSRFFRAAGIPSYGFTPFMALATDAATINGPDERIALPAFVGGVQVYSDLLFLVLGLN